MKLSDLPFVDEIRERYIELREEELQRKKAVLALMREYPDEIEDVDDAAQFWLGIASGQDELGELNEEYRQKTLSALETWGEDLSCFDAGELDFLHNKSSGKKRSTSSYWTWKPGEVYMYTFGSEFARKAQLEGYRLLIYVADYEKITQRKIYPVVYFLLWSGSGIPTSREIESCAFVELHRPFRNVEKTACRKLFISASRQEFEEFNAKLECLGDYGQLRVPQNEAGRMEYDRFERSLYLENDIRRAREKGALYYIDENGSPRKAEIPK